MKKKTLSLIISINLSLFINAQTFFVPSGTNGIGTSGNDNVGIGTSTPGEKLEVVGVMRTINLGTAIATWDNLSLWSDGENSYIHANGDEKGLHIKSNTGGKILLESNVGIGTTAPQYPLDVSGAIRATNDLYVTGSNGEGGPAISIVNNAKSLVSQASAWKIYNMSGSYGNSLQFWAYDNIGCTSGGLCNNRFTLMDNGNVGIGTMSPQSKLDVNGDVQFKGMFGYELPDVFTYKNTTVPHYGFRWNQDDWYSGGHTMLLSSYGGFKLFTSGAPHFFITANGNVGIKTENPRYELDVLGTIRAKEVLVNLDGGADFVFEKDYKLPALDHVATYVQENKHLPDIPSANEMTKNGVSMGDMQVKLLQKVEELTLYVIELKKEIETMKKQPNNQ